MLQNYLTYPRSENLHWDECFTKESDPLHKEWAKTVSNDRREFFKLAEQSTRGLTPVKDTYKAGYKSFFKYLETTLDVVEMMPQFSPSKLVHIYRSGICEAQLNTVEDGPEASVIAEMVIVKWVYCMTLYNNIVDEYRNLDRHQNFQGLQDGLNYLVKGLEDILVRLVKLDHLGPHIWVRLASYDLGQNSSPEVHATSRVQSGSDQSLHSLV